jgi:hypothetical protein
LFGRWSETARLRTELEVVSERELRPLLDALGENVEVVRDSFEDDRYTIWVELCPPERDVDEAVQRYVRLSEALPREVRAVWDAYAAYRGSGSSRVRRWLRRLGFR